MTTVMNSILSERHPNCLKLYTIGFSFAPFKTIINKLIKNHIEKLVDVRYDRFSDNIGFNGFNQNLALKFLGYGIDYEHRWELGNPPTLKNVFFHNRNIWRLKFFQQFQTGERLAYQDLFTRNITCLMASTKKPKNCHRAEVARWIVQGSNPKIRVIHL